MKRHLMTVLALCAGMAVHPAVGETYEKGKVYGPIVELGDEARTIDGNGAIIDGGGTARCATLGPNVTLVNFTFRNGKTAVGGGVWGGAVQSCTITGCTATEYGAAVANCKVRATAITGCTLPLSSSKVAIHGGIAADSTLDGVTITGCSVALGASAPGFGGIAANSALTNCSVTDNTLVISGDHYGFLFYGGSLSKSTIQGNTVDSSLANVAAYMKVTPDGCTLDGDPGPTPPGPTPPGPVPPGPPPPGPPPGSVFEGNANYGGYLVQDGVVCGTVTVKAGKPKNGLSSVKLTIQPLGGKKTTLKKSVAVGGCPTVDGLTYSSSVIGGTVAINGVLYEVLAQADALTSPDRTVKTLAKSLVPSGTWTFSLVDSSGVETCFSATVAAKTGKTKVTALLPNGKKVTVSAAAQLGTDFKVLSVPVVYSKKDISFAFLLQVDVETKVMALSGLSVPVVSLTGPAALTGIGSGNYGFLCPLDGTKYLTVVDGMVSGEKVNISPSGTLMTVLGGKWTVEKSVGSVKAEDGRPYVKYNVGRQDPANLAKLKLKYAAKTGIVSGSFKLYYMDDSGKLKNESAVVNGVVVGDDLHGAATVKKAGLVLPIGTAPVLGN